MTYPKILFCLLLLFIEGALYAQSSLPDNLDIETVKDEIAAGWTSFGQGGLYELTVSEEAHSGSYALNITHKSGDEGFHAWAMEFAPDFEGKKIKLTGYMRTEDVSDGFAGLWLRIDPNVGFDNMEGQQIMGTNDWQQFEVELDYNVKVAEKVVFGGLVVGKGKAWFDDFEIFVDGRPLDQAPAKKRLPAQVDTAYNNGSGLSFDLPLSDENIQDLSLLGKVWGLLKYHHPTIAVGELNWDNELFRFVPKYTSASDKSAALLQWINSLGRVEDCASCARPESAEVMADFGWIDSEVPSSDLRDALYHIIDNRPAFEHHYYISSYPGIGNPKFKNETAYDNESYPDEGLRYLAAIRFWNMIQYYFPYREETDVDWNDALAENLSAIVGAADEYAYERAMTRMIGQVKDTHANLWGGGDQVSERRGKFRPPFRATFVEEKLVVVDYYAPGASPDKNMPQIGDIITHIDGQRVEDYIRAEEEYYPASNPSARLRDIGENILRSPDSLMSLTTMRDGQSIELSIPLLERGDIENYYQWYRRSEEPAYKMLDDNIGYLTLANVTDEAYAEAKETFKNAKGIIIDIRNYPSAFGPFAFGGFLLKEETPFVKFTSMDMDHPGYFTMSAPLTIEPDGEPFEGKVVVLVNELSQSQAEYTSMAFRASPNTTIIGSQTAGADGNVSRIDLPGGMRTMISGLGVFYPDGTKTQRIGIVPDIEVKPTIAGIRASRDELVEKAIEEIMEGKE
ncbi:MAG: S41 family peptidase [Bacteroidota bacterium]